MDWDKILTVIREQKINKEEDLKLTEEDRARIREKWKQTRKEYNTTFEAKRAQLEAILAEAREAHDREKQELEHKLRLAQATGYIRRDERAPTEISVREVSVTDF